MYWVISNSPSSPQSYVSAKVQGSSHSQSPWSGIAIEPSPTYAQLPPQPTPWAPYMSPTPLPHSGTSHGHQAPHGTFPPPTSPHSSSPSLHPILEFDRSGRFTFNITLSLQNIQFRQNIEVNPNEPAVWPLAAQVCITVPGCPNWSFKVVNHSGVTVHDVLSQIFREFQRGIPRQEFVMFTPQMQTSTSHAFHTRTNGNPAEHRLGAKRVDFLGPKTFFVGLCRAADGSDAWDVKFASTVV